MATFQMDNAQKNYFKTLYSTGNITQAASKLYLSRQGLSKSIRALEKALGTTLFVREKSGVKPTKAGEALLEYLEKEELLWNECLSSIDAVAQQDPEIVRVGLLSMYVGYQQKRSLFASFKDNSRIKIEVVDGDHPDYWRAISEGSLDFAFSIAPPPDCRLPSIRLSKDQLAVLLSVDHPLAKKSVVDFGEDLKGRTIIQTSPYKQKLYAPILKAHGIKSESITHDKNLMLARVSTSEDCFLIQNQYAELLATDQVCIRPVSNSPINMDTTFVCRADLDGAALIVAKTMLEAYDKVEELNKLQLKENSR